MKSSSVFVSILLIAIFRNAIAEKLKDGKVLNIDQKDFLEILDRHDFVFACIGEPHSPITAIIDQQAQKFAKEMAPTRYDLVVIKCDWNKTPAFWNDYGIYETPGFLWFFQGKKEEDVYRGSPDYDKFKKWALTNMRKNAPKKNATTMEPDKNNP